MKNSVNFLCAMTLMSALCSGLASCNEPQETETGLGEEIPGMEIKQATGTIIGSYANGFGSLLVQVDDEYPIGEAIEYFDFFPCTTLPEDGIYRNMIQVQCNLPVERNKRISFSVREYQTEKDKDLFTVGSGVDNAMCANPDVPVYVITNYQILNN